MNGLDFFTRLFSRRKITYLLTLFVSSIIFSQEKSLNSKLIHLSEFSAYKGKATEETSKKIYNYLEKNLISKGFTVVKADKSSIQQKIINAKKENARILVDGYYKIAEDGSLNIYTQMYDPEKGYMIDAVNVTNEIPELDGIKLDPKETRKSDEEIIFDLEKKIAVRIRTNPKNIERRENINESVVQTGMAQELNLPLPQENISKETEEVFKFLAEKEIVTTASNVVTDVEKQPASITVINQEQIKHSGARSVNELLTMFVPGFFTVEDQDDTIAGFRGFAPDNNAKVLLLINGHNMNTEYFWGPPDSIINGMNLDYIDKIEVIRGPGSVTLGQGALLGVINIITKKGHTFPGTSVQAAGGPNGYSKGTIQAGAEGKEISDLKTFFQYSTSKYNGQEIRSEGWAKAKGFETVEADYNLQRGLTKVIPSSSIGSSDWVLANDGNQAIVNQRNIASGFQRLKRSEQDTILGNIQYKGLEFTGFYTRQSRDLYNFYRDRNILDNTIKSGNVVYSYDFSDKISIKTKAYYTVDDMILRSQRGYTMGGTREYRYGGSIILNLKDIPKNNNLAIGVEFRKYDMGQGNSDGNNFILNNANEALLKSPNYNNRYVYPFTINIRSLFLEDFYKLSEKIDLFGAFRYDRHPNWGGNISPRLGTIYTHSQSLRFRVSYQEGFRGVVGASYAGGFQGDGHLRVQNFQYITAAAIPNSFDSNGRPTGYYSSVPETKPERMRSVELATNYKFSNNLSLENVLFYNNLRNIIDVGVLYCDKPNPKGGCIMPNLGSDVPGDWNGYWFYKNAAGEIRQVGSELTITYKQKIWTTSFSHALVKVVTASSSQFASIYLTSDVNNLRFLGYPENVFRWNNLFKPIDRLSISLNYLFYPNWYSPRGNRVEGNHIINSTIFYKIMENMQLGLTLRNAMNQRNLYPMISNAGGQDLSDGTPAIEKRNYWLSLIYSF